MNFITFLLALLFAMAVNAHMAMYQPCARGSIANKNCPAPPPGASYDYEIKSPIGTKDGIVSPLCKNTVPFSAPTETWTAGQPVTVSFEAGGAAHGGGHCQFALSYDGGNTYVVVQDEKRYCFFDGPSSNNDASELSYTFTLPASVPAGDKVIFSWTWINAIGNREFYMNCADIAIKSSSSSYSGPQMLIANYGSQYPVIPEFNGNYETGLDLFDKRPIITVYSNGGNSNVVYQGSPSGDVPSPTVNPVYTTTSNTSTTATTTSTTATTAPTTTAYLGVPTNLPVQPTQTSNYNQPIQTVVEDIAPPAQPSNTEYRPNRRPGSSGNPPAANTQGGSNIRVAQADLTEAASTEAPEDQRAFSATEPSGACTVGKMMCDTNDSSSFLVCNQGSFVKFSVPPGTTCLNTDDGYVSFAQQ